METPSTLRVLEGTEALSLVHGEVFRRDWAKLVDGCPWSTPFQDIPFVTTWYDTYRERFTPLLVLDQAPDGQLNGLFALATDPDQRVVIAGGRQAEYQVWLALPGFAERFPAAALAALRSRLRADLTLQYAPAMTPLDGLRGTSVPGVSIRATEASRPLMSVGTVEDAAESFKKKSNKSRLNRLAKVGPVRFDRLTRPEELGAFIDQIAQVYDVRQASLGGTPPFLTDPLKAPFHLNLLNSPNVLHASVLRAGDVFVAGHLGVMGRSVVHVGVLAHSPFFAAHSPGKLLMMFLAQLLATEGIATLDLTPGGDGWKERFADQHDVVTRLVVSGSRAAAVRADVTSAGLGIAARGLRTVGVSPASVRRAVDSARGKSIATLIKSAGRQGLGALHRRAELRAYSQELDSSVIAPSGFNGLPLARRDALDDVARFEPAPGTPDRTTFFKLVLARIEEGHHIYTRVEQGRLLHWGWLAERQEKALLDEVHQEFVYPSDSGVLYDFYTHPDARGRGLYRSSIRQMIADGRASGLARVFIFVLANNGPSRRVIETSGFSYLGSLFERQTLRQSTKWRTIP